MFTTTLFKRTYQILIAISLAVGLYFFCDWQTRGFRTYLILSNLPNDARWEVPALPPEQQAEIDRLLDQPFTYLGSGGWCYAFLGADQKTVLKFYKHSHLRPDALLKEFSFEKLLFKSPPWKEGAPYFQEFNFKSCVLMYKEAKERTGLLYVHLNKTEGKHKPVTLFDNIGIQHTIDLDKTEFVVQEKAELLIPHLQKLLENNKMQEAKHCIDDLLDCLLSFYQKGIKDFDKSIRKNFGFIGDTAISLDLSSFGPQPSLKEPVLQKRELLLKMHRVSRWMKKHYPELHKHYEERIQILFEHTHPN